MIVATAKSWAGIDNTDIKVLGRIIEPELEFNRKNIKIVRNKLIIKYPNLNFFTIIPNLYNNMQIDPQQKVSVRDKIKKILKQK